MPHAAVVTVVLIMVTMPELCLAAFQAMHPAQALAHAYALATGLASEDHKICLRPPTEHGGDTRQRYQSAMLPAIAEVD